MTISSTRLESCLYKTFISYLCTLSLLLRSRPYCYFPSVLLLEIIKAKLWLSGIFFCSCIPSPESGIHSLCCGAAGNCCLPIVYHPQPCCWCRYAATEPALTFLACLFLVQLRLSSRQSDFQHSLPLTVFSTGHKYFQPFSFRAKMLLDELSLPRHAISSTWLLSIAQWEFPEVHFWRSLPGSKTNVPGHIYKAPFFRSCIPARGVHKFLLTTQSLTLALGSGIAFPNFYMVWQLPLSCLPFYWFFVCCI